MDDLEKYIEKRNQEDKNFVFKFDEGFEKFKIGILLRKARTEAKITQTELAKRLNTKKSSISRIENHAEDIKLSTLVKVAAALDKQLKIYID